MIPNNRALVPLLPERLAALRAIIFVEDKRATDPTWKCYDYPYAQAFFRFLCGKGKVCGKSLNKVFGIRYDAKERLTTLRNWEIAIDDFIRSQGRYCPTPLSGDMVDYIFPEQAFLRKDRENKRHDRRFSLYSRRRSKEAASHELEYQNLVGRAEIELAFQTPETLRAWYCHWSREDIRKSDMDSMLWGFIERMPSLSHIERSYFSADDPSWYIENEIWHAVKEATVVQKMLDRWMVPNKLALREEDEDEYCQQKNKQKRGRDGFPPYCHPCCKVQAGSKIRSG